MWFLFCVVLNVAFIVLELTAPYFIRTLSASIDDIRATPSLWSVHFPVPPEKTTVTLVSRTFLHAAFNLNPPILFVCFQCNFNYHLCYPAQFVHSFNIADAISGSFVSKIRSVINPDSWFSPHHVIFLEEPPYIG